MNRRPSLSYGQRNKLLGLVSAFSAVVAYVVSIQPTLDLWTSTNQKTTALGEIQQAPRVMRQLQAQARQYEQVMRSFGNTSTRQEGYALDELTSACQRHRVMLASLSPGERSLRNGYQVETRVAKLRGSFHGLVQVLYELEYQRSIGRLSSVRFALEEDRKQHRNFLFAYLYLQNISSE